MLLYPSLMGADPLNLQKTIAELEPYCAGFHLDMMDGHLVPNIAGGPDWINAIAAFAKKPVWIHLMVSTPTAWIEQFELQPQSMIDFQCETKDDHEKALYMIKDRGFKAGFSIGPCTSLRTIEPLLNTCSYVTIMGVKPGFAGQPFIPESIERIKELNAYKMEHKLTFFIACDGGITEAILPSLAAAGVTHAAVASALFSAPDRKAWLQKNGQ